MRTIAADQVRSGDLSCFSCRKIFSNRNYVGILCSKSITRVRFRIDNLDIEAACENIIGSR
jgi:hypothetical protein